jgi:peptidyl-tRNA hydrolase
MTNSIEVERGVVFPGWARVMVPSSPEEMMASVEPVTKNDRYLKQVIVMRKDLTMPSGKLATMVAHASIKFLVDRLENKHTINRERMQRREYMEGPFTQDEIRWMKELDPGIEHTGQQSMAKIVVFVNSLDELIEVEIAAKRNGLTVGTVYDSGYSHNPPGTYVGLAIGPHWPEAFEGVTDHLKTR